jgi:periplasmic divalent cation tolerance protein
MSEGLVVLVTVGTRDEAERLAQAVVEERLAACVNVVGPMVSIYRWQGQVQRDDEILLVIKTQHRRFDQLAARLSALHSYDNPEIVGLPIVAGAAPYLVWLLAETQGPTG